MERQLPECCGLDPFGVRLILRAVAVLIFSILYGVCPSCCTFGCGHPLTLLEAVTDDYRMIYLYERVEIKTFYGPLCWDLDHICLLYVFLLCDTVNHVAHCKYRGLWHHLIIRVLNAT